MKVNKNFEIIEVADEHIAVPLGEEAVSFHGVIVLSEPAAYVLTHFPDNCSIDDLIKLIMEEYDISQCNAEQDIKLFVQKLYDLNLLLNV